MDRKLRNLKRRILVKCPATKTRRCLEIFDWWSFTQFSIYYTDVKSTCANTNSRGPRVKRAPNTGQKIKIILGWKLVRNTFLGRWTRWKHFLAILKISLGFGQFFAKNDQIWRHIYIIALVLLTISYILTAI